VPAREGEKHLPGVQPLPSRQAETQLRGVQSLPPRQAETRLQGVQLLPSRQAEKHLLAVQPLPSWQAETALRGVQLLPSRQVETELRGLQSGTRGSAEFKASQTRARERVDDGSYKTTSTMMEDYNVHQHYIVHTKKRLHYNVLLVNIFSCNSI
jgi:hypothetical protein